MNEKPQPDDSTNPGQQQKAEHKFVGNTIDNDDISWNYLKVLKARQQNEDNVLGVEVFTGVIPTDLPNDGTVNDHQQ